MSLLNVTVKRAKYTGVQDIQAAQFNTYVTLKLQNVKSTTVTVKGSDPCWEQDFLFETNNGNSGLLVEVWTKGMIWDRALGYKLISLDQIPYSTVETLGQWYQLDTEVVLMDGEVAGTRIPTGHMILLDCRFELSFDPDTQPGDLQRKLEMLNGIMNQQMGQYDRRHRQNQYMITSGYSEDSDYTSDLNYPVGQNANSSASQYRNLETPQRSLETSRENSYEKECYEAEADTSFYNGQMDVGDEYSPELGDYQMAGQSQIDDPLFYNSRPLSRQDTMYDEYDTYDMNEDWDTGGCGSSINKILPTLPIQHSNSVTEELIYQRTAVLPVPPVRLLPTVGSRALPRIRSVLNRTDSDQDSVHSTFTYRPGAVSAINYNEDYNYAYQSTDSLNQTYSEYGGGGQTYPSDYRRRKGANLPAIPTGQKPLPTKLSRNAIAFLSQATTVRSADIVMEEEEIVVRKAKRLPIPIPKVDRSPSRLPVIPVARKKLPVPPRKLSIDFEPIVTTTTNTGTGIYTAPSIYTATSIYTGTNNGKSIDDDQLYQDEEKSYVEESMYEEPVYVPPVTVTSPPAITGYYQPASCASIKSTTAPSIMSSFSTKLTSVLSGSTTVTPADQTSTLTQQTAALGTVLTKKFSSIFQATKTMPQTTINQTTNRLFTSTIQMSNRTVTTDIYQTYGDQETSTSLLSNTGQVDYNDTDYKYGYDDDYTETDYIATGDITDIKSTDVIDYQNKIIDSHRLNETDEYNAADRQRDVAILDYGKQFLMKDGGPLPLPIPDTANFICDTIYSDANSYSLERLERLERLDSVDTKTVTPDCQYDTDTIQKSSDYYAINEPEEVIIDPDYKMATVTTVITTTSGSYHQMNNYTYQDDFFNEEDEYKYLEKEQEEGDVDAGGNGTDPQEYFEEEVEEEQEEEEQHAVPPPSGTERRKLTKHQDSIDDNEFFLQHANKMLQLNKQEPIVEEDEVLPPSVVTPQQPTKSIKSLMDPDRKLDGLVSGIASAAVAAVTTTMATGTADMIGETLAITEDESGAQRTVLIRGDTDDISGGKKSEITAKQRWNWAYNKIIMQLNVSIRDLV